ncbi:MAG: hypothetical protein AB1689_20495 [Thermodesulfobacteriota bacterium]
MRSVLAFLLLVVSSTPSFADTVLQITSCDAVVPPRKRAVLAADLVCEGRCSSDPSVGCRGDASDACPGAAPCSIQTLQLGRGARLSLAGHGVTIGHGGIGIGCGEETYKPLPHRVTGRCVVEGPGSIVAQDAIAVSSRIGLRISDLHVDAASLYANDLQVENVDFVPFRESTIGGGRVRLRRMTVGSAGVIANAIVAEDVVLAEHSGGLHATLYPGTIRGRDVTVVGSNEIRAIDVSLRRLRALPPAQPVPPPGYRFLVHAEEDLKLFDSTADVIGAGASLRFVRSSCRQSVKLFTGPSWGVCAED